MEQKKKPYFIRLAINIRKNYILYLLVFIPMVYYFVFHYIPMYGVTIAFKDFIAKEGILGSPWIGLDNFIRFFKSYNCINIILNTLQISVYSLLFGFPLTIIFSLMLHYFRRKRMKKVIEMVSYAPHFISTVVICGMIVVFLQNETGIINILLGKLGIDSIAFLNKPELFKPIYIITGIWQTLGWSSIIYIAALSGVDYQMHEAAMIDGASIFRRIICIDIPSILPTIVMMFILQVGNLMNVGFEKVFLLQNSLNLTESEIIATYVYKVGLISNDFGYSTAIGLFNSVINIILLVTFNFLSKKITSHGLW